MIQTPREVRAYQQCRDTFDLALSDEALFLLRVAEEELATLIRSKGTQYDRDQHLCYTLDSNQQIQVLPELFGVIDSWR